MTNLSDLHQAVFTGCQQISGIQTVATLPQRLDGMVLPALLLDCIELTPAQDFGTGELMLDSHWALRLIVSEQQCKDITLALLQVVLQTLYYQRWGLSQVEPVQLKQASLDHLTPTLQGHIVWLVEWTQFIVLGESVWDATGIVPETIQIREQHND